VSKLKSRLILMVTLLTAVLFLFYVSSRGQTPAGGYSSPQLGGSPGGVSLTPSSTQTIIGTTNAITPLVVQPGAGTDAAIFQVNSDQPSPIFTVGTGSGGDHRLPIITIGSGLAFGFDSYKFTNTFNQQIAAASTTPDFPIEVASVATTPTTPVASTNILASAPAGTYEVSYYSVVTTTGTVGTSFSLNFIYTDAQQAQTIAAFTNITFTAGNVNQGTFIIQNQATNNINYSITEIGVFTVHPVLSLKIIMKRIL
jgi:hypothetical protein